MKKLERLILYARQSVLWRGHKNSNFKHDPLGALYNCPDCGMYAIINLHPAPNSIATHGRALALNCTKEAQAAFPGEN